MEETIMKKKNTLLKLFFWKLLLWLNVFLWTIISFALLFITFFIGDRVIGTWAFIPTVITGAACIGFSAQFAVSNYNKVKRLP
jgi:hypothetical protein